MVERNTFLVEFASKAEMEEVIHREPWTYRNDVVSVRRVCDQEEVNSSSTMKVELWTQLHNIPPELMTDKGARYIANRLGPRISEVRPAMVTGKPFYRVKVAYELGVPMQDVLKIHHEVLGEKIIHLVYEKAHRICLFCGHLGHELGHCKDYGKVMRMASDPTYQNRPELEELQEHRLGAWINNMSAVPRGDTITGPSLEQGPQVENRHKDNGSDQHQSNKRASLSGSRGQRFSNHPLDDHLMGATDPAGSALAIHESTDNSSKSPSSKRFRAASPKSPPPAP